MSERINEKKETNGESDIARLLDRREVGDAGRVVVVLKAARAEGENAVGAEEFHSYMYLLSNLGTVPTAYWFRSRPLPFSAKMEDDIAYLAEVGFVSRDSPLSITDTGKEWVRETLLDDEGVILKAIWERVSEWRTLTLGELFDVACAVYIRK